MYFYIKNWIQKKVGVVLYCKNMDFLLKGENNKSSVMKTFPSYLQILLRPYCPQTLSLALWRKTNKQTIASTEGMIIL